MEDRSSLGYIGQTGAACARDDKHGGWWIIGARGWTTLEVDAIKGYRMPLCRLAKSRRGPRLRTAIRPIPDRRAGRGPISIPTTGTRLQGRTCIQIAHDRRAAGKRTLAAQSRCALMTDVICALKQLDHATRRSGATSARAFRSATRQASACARCWDLRRSVRSSPAYIIACATLPDANSITSGFTSRSKSRNAILMSSKCEPALKAISRSSVSASST